MNEINTFLDFNKVKQDPEAYKGQVILLGGAVVTVKSFLESPLQIEVVQGPLDSQDVPTLKSSSGRFFVLSKEAPNPETVLKDQLCRMVIGEIDGVQYQEIGGLGHLPFNKG
jgi:starvation-inducible outer membrane lipoprotein